MFSDMYNFLLEMNPDAKIYTDNKSWNFSIQNPFYIIFSEITEPNFIYRLSLV